MDILYLLIPVSLLLVAGIVWAFLWAIHSGQFDDLEGPAHEILMDDENRQKPPAPPDPDKKQPDGTLLPK